MLSCVSSSPFFLFMNLNNIYGWQRIDYNYSCKWNGYSISCLLESKSMFWLWTASWGIYLMTCHERIVCTSIYFVETWIWNIQTKVVWKPEILFFGPLDYFFNNIDMCLVNILESNDGNGHNFQTSILCYINFVSLKSLTYLPKIGMKRNFWLYV